MFNPVLFLGIFNIEKKSRNTDLLLLPVDK
jgi:hypothetical protein